MIGFLSYGCRTQQLGWSRTSQGRRSRASHVAGRRSHIRVSRWRGSRVARHALQVADAGRVGTDIDILSVVRAARAAMARPARSLGHPDREGGAEPAWPKF